RGTLAALHARSLAAPITYQSLMDIVDRWTINSLNLTERDIKLMERLARAQVRKAGGANAGAVDEIKRFELDRAWDEEGTGITGISQSISTRSTTCSFSRSIASFPSPASITSTPRENRTSRAIMRFTSLSSTTITRPESVPSPSSAIGAESSAGDGTNAASNG